MESITGTTLLGITKNTDGLYVHIQAPTSAVTIDTTASRYAPGCICTNIGSGVVYRNAGTTATPVWSKMEDRYVTTATGTDDGLTTGLVPEYATFVTVTSSAATKAVTLPTISSETVGKTVDLYVGSNGYELLTPATSGNTINTVDSDGTNQLDVAANTLLRCTQVSSTGWACFQVAATTITVVAPDND